MTHIAGGIGDWDGSQYPIFDDILEFDETEEDWKKVGAMSVKRFDHAVAVINYNSIVEYCT